MHTGRLYFFTNSKEFLSSKEFISLIRLTPFFIASNITSPLEESIETTARIFFISSKIGINLSISS